MFLLAVEFSPPPYFCEQSLYCMLRTEWWCSLLIKSLDTLFHSIHREDVSKLLTNSVPPRGVWGI